MSTFSKIKFVLTTEETIKSITTNNKKNLIENPNTFFPKNTTTKTDNFEYENLTSSVTINHSPQGTTVSKKFNHDYVERNYNKIEITLSTKITNPSYISKNNSDISSFTDSTNFNTLTRTFSNNHINGSTNITTALDQNEISTPFYDYIFYFVLIFLLCIFIKFNYVLIKHIYQKFWHRNNDIELLMLS